MNYKKLAVSYLVNRFKLLRVSTTSSYWPEQIFSTDKKKFTKCKGRRVLAFALSFSTWQVEASFCEWAHFHIQAIKKVFPKKQ
jgi:hypothetical protein